LTAKKYFSVAGNVIFEDNSVKVQVSLAIRGGSVPEISQTVNNKTIILGPNQANLD
jgi:hypothetical protein